MQNPYEVDGHSLIEIERGYKDIQGNKFWEYFWSAVEYDLQNAYKNAGDSLDKEEKVLRIIQGEVKALKSIMATPAKLIEYVYNKLGKSD